MKFEMKSKNSKKNLRTDWDRLKKMSDKDIDFSDIPPLKADFFKNAKLRIPKAKPLISIRLDADILEWIKAQGPGYQTKINAILRLYMETNQK
jgi:uncharacterized protein (DUF4415 family)